MNALSCEVARSDFLFVTKFARHATCGILWLIFNRNNKLESTFIAVVLAVVILIAADSVVFGFAVWAFVVHDIAFILKK